MSETAELVSFLNISSDENNLTDSSQSSNKSDVPRLKCIKCIIVTFDSKIWNGFSLILIGSSDCNRVFRPVGVSLCFLANRMCVSENDIYG